ncbi:hypothetical protein GCM10009536_19400 [Streptomyces thermocarboxydus]
MRGRRGSDWVLPGTSARTPADDADDADEATAPADATTPPDAAPAAGGASGRARAAAQVTPIEEARIPRMPLSLDIVRHICPSVI